MNNELRRIRENVVIAEFKILIRRMLRGNKEKGEETESGPSVPGPQLALQDYVTKNTR